MAQITLEDGRTIEFDDGLAPEQVEELIGAASQSAGGDMEPEALSPMGLITNFPSDAYEAGANMVDAIRHPVRTFEGMSDLTGGLLRKIPEMRPQWLQDLGKTLNDSPITRALGQQNRQTPEDFARQDATGDAFDQMLEERWSTPTRAWNTVVENPADALLTLAPGLGVAGKTAQVAKLPRAANTLNKAAEFTNPVNLIKKPAAAVADRYAPRVPGLPRMTSALLRNAAPADLKKFDKLGPAGMTLDWSPSTVGLAQGVTMGPGEAKNMIVDLLTKRHEGRSDRLLHGAQNTLGRLRDPVALKKTINKAGQRAAGPHYRLAKQNPPDIRSPALEQLIQVQMTDPMKGMSLSKRQKTMEYFNKIEDAWFAGNPADTVSRLHSLRQELDTKIYDNKVMGEDKIVAQEVRKTVDDILKNRVPGFMEGDKIISKSKKAQEDIDFGYDALDGGKSAMFPETFIKEFGKRDPKMVGEGVKGRVANALGTSANDTAAMKRVIGDGNDFNRRKLVKTFGQGKTDDIVDMVDAEDTMGQNFSTIAGGSQTAQRLAAQAQTGQLKLPEMSSSATITGTLGNTFSKALNKLLSKGAGKLSDTNNRALMEALTLAGPQARLLFQLLKNPPKGRRVNDTALIKALIAGNAAGALEFPRDRQ